MSIGVIALIVGGAVILGPLLLISLGIFYWAMWNVVCHLYEHSMAIREVRKFRRAVKEMRKERAQ